MPEFKYDVTIVTDTVEQANQVMDGMVEEAPSLGIYYQIHCEAHRFTWICSFCANFKTDSGIDLHDHWKVCDKYPLNGETLYG